MTAMGQLLSSRPTAASGRCGSVSGLSTASVAETSMTDKLHYDKSCTFGGERPTRARRQAAALGRSGFAACHRASASRGFETVGSMISC